jgi:superfamily II DNA/RNA helicase
MIHLSKYQARSTVFVSLNAIVRLLHVSRRLGDEHTSNSLETFESLGVDKHVVRGLKRAFPHITSPTFMQKEFIPAIMSGKDVLLQDRAGTGK